MKTLGNGSECSEDNSENPAQPQVNEDQYQYDTIITAGKLLDEIIPMNHLRTEGVTKRVNCEVQKNSYMLTGK